MSQGIASLHKILKDETRQKIIILLNNKGSLSYSNLMDQAEVLSTGLLNYHLKVLGDLLQKNDTGHYALSDKGRLAYKVLTEFPNAQSKVVDKRIYKAWIILTAASVILLILNGYFLSIPVERTSLALAILLLASAAAFYIRIRPSTSGNRVFFVAVGAGCLGFLLWFAVSLIILHTGMRWTILKVTGDLGNDLFALASLIICWVIGGYIGDWLGKRRGYVIPTIRV